MGKDLNEGFVIGRLGGDPEMKYTTSGTAVATFSLAVGDDYYDNNKKEFVQRTNWLRFTAWRERAERITEKCKKGDRLMVKFQLVNNNYEKDGKTVYKDEYVVVWHQALDSSGSSSHEEQLDDEAPF